MYHRANNLPKAIELVFKYRKFGALDQLVEELDQNTDQNVLSRCGEFFLENYRHAQAASIFLLAQKYEEAIKLIVDYDLEVTPKMATLLKLPKDYPNKDKLMQAAASHCFAKTLFKVGLKQYVRY